MSAAGPGEAPQHVLAKPIVAADLLAKMDDLGLLASHAEVAYEGMRAYHDYRARFPGRPVTPRTQGRSRAP